MLERPRYGVSILVLECPSNRKRYVEGLSDDRALCLNTVPTTPSSCRTPCRRAGPTQPADQVQYIVQNSGAVAYVVSGPKLGSGGAQALPGVSSLKAGIGARAFKM